jgi:sugar lactone lactonase YvrE
MRIPVIALTLLACLLTACGKEEESGDSDPGALQIVTASLPPAIASAAYSVPISAAGGSGSGYAWSLVSGSLPPGLGLSPTGTPDTSIMGVPTSLGSFNFTLQVQDSAGAAFTRALHIQVNNAISISTTSLLSAEQTKPYSAAVVATGGTGTGISWSITSGSLPPGLTLASSGTLNATLMGIPTLQGVFNFTVTCTDSASVTASRPLSLAVVPPLVILSGTLPAAGQGVSYSQAIAASGGTSAAFAWAVSSGNLPQGMALSPSGTPSTSLQGFPFATGVSNFTLTVLDSEGHSASKSFSLEVLPALEILTTWLPDATVNGAYTMAVSAIGGSSAGYAWSIVQGALPGGITLSPTGTPTATLSGIPVASGTFTFKLRVTDSRGLADELRLKLVVEPASTALALADQLLPSPVTTRAYSQLVAASGGTGLGYVWTLLTGTLPPGLGLGATGTPATTISGTPVSSGSYSFTLQVTDSASNTASRAYTLDVFSPGYINVVAGGGSGATGGIGNGGPALNSTLADARGVCFDAAQNLYIADKDHSRVRRVNAGTGQITTVAGTVSTGYSGDGGPGTQAELWLPHDVVVHDASNSLYIADYGNHVVRRLDLVTGIITTYAGGGSGGLGDGGQAVAAQMEYPEGLAVNAAGDLFIATRTNLYGCRIRKVTSSTGIISTVAGTGQNGFNGDGIDAAAAQLDNPRDVAVDSAGNIFIADTSNFRIRRVDASTNLISTVCGTGSYGFGGDGSAATSAAISGVASLFFDSAGDLWFADENNHRVRRINMSSGIVSTLAGSGPSAPSSGGFAGDGGPAVAARLNRPNSMAINAAGHLYISDSYNSLVRRVDSGTQVITSVVGGSLSYGDGLHATEALLISADDVVADRYGNLFICDTDHHRVRRVDAVSGRISTVAGVGTAGYSGDGGLATLAMLNLPIGLSIDADGNLFIADTNNQRLRRVDATTGVMTTLAGTGTAGYSGDGGQATLAQITDPLDVAWDPAGFVLICESRRLRRVNLASGIISTVTGAGSPGFSGDGGPASAAETGMLTSVCLDASRNIFISDSGNYRVRRIDAVSDIIDTVAGNGSGGDLNSPQGISVDRSGKLFVCDFLHYQIKTAMPGSTALTVVAGTGNTGISGDGGPALSADIYPFGVAVLRNGDFLISGPDRVRLVFKP